MKQTAFIALLLTSFSSFAQNVGVNTPSPAYPLDVNGRLRLRYNGNSPGVWLNKADNTLASFLGQYNDTTFGLYDAAGSAWRFAFVQNTGNLGIGNLNPTLAGLVVDKRVGAVNALFGGNLSGVAIESSFPGIGLNSYYSGGRKSIAAGYGGWMGHNPISGDFTIQTSTASGTAGNALAVNTRLMIDKDGDIGIEGNTAPHAPLSFANIVGDKISLYGGTPTSNYGIGIQGYLMQLYTDAANADIAFGYGGSGNFTETARIKGNGILGIGTANPTDAGLVVNKKVGAVNALFGSNTTGVAIESAYPGIAFNTYYNGGRRFIANGYGGLVSFNPDNGNLSLLVSPTSGSTNGTANLTEAITVLPNGNVGINHTNPGSQLAVVGTAKFSQGSDNAAVDIDGAIKVSGNNKPVFVLTCTASNLADAFTPAVNYSPSTSYYTSVIVDNSLCNNDPNAILLVTPVNTAIPIAVYYESNIGKWKIRIDPHGVEAGECFALASPRSSAICGGPNAIAIMPYQPKRLEPGRQFNVMIVKQ